MFLLFKITPTIPIVNNTVVIAKNKYILNLIIFFKLGVLGIEPSSIGLKVHCSTSELHTFLDYTANSNKNTIISTKSAMASVKANPRIAILNNSSFNEGFLEIPKIRALKITPIPIPAPVKPIVAIPAPKNFAA